MLMRYPALEDIQYIIDKALRLRDGLYSSRPSCQTPEGSSSTEMPRKQVSIVPVSSELARRSPSTTGTSLSSLRTPGSVTPDPALSIDPKERDRVLGQHMERAIRILQSQLEHIESMRLDVVYLALASLKQTRDVLNGTAMFDPISSLNESLELVLAGHKALSDDAASTFGESIATSTADTATPLPTEFESLRI